MDHTVGPEPDTDRPLRSEEEPAGVVDEIHKQVTDALDECSRDANSISAKRVLSQAFERELDELHTPAGSSYYSDKQTESREEEEARVRDEHTLMGVVSAVAARALREHGLRVTKCERDFMAPKGGGAYVLAARDREGRRYEAKWGHDLAESLTASGGSANLVERIGHAVARKVLEERGVYFARMGVT